MNALPSTSNYSFALSQHFVPSIDSTICSKVECDILLRPLPNPGSCMVQARERVYPRKKDCSIEIDFLTDHAKPWQAMEKQEDKAVLSTLI
ncbi:hypothetical protein J6590_088706 [Homalodisca vitripennis]|nr:hypothetical protein J6590_088706 [Homalodisca vitripennis]